MHNFICTPKPPVDAPATCMVEEPLAVEASTEGLGVQEDVPFEPSTSPLCEAKEAPRFVKRGSPVQSRGAAPSDLDQAKPRKSAGCHSSKEAVLSAGSRCAIRAYCARSPWIDRRDIEQEAALASLGSDPIWEARVVALALSRFVAEQRCPVSLPKHQGEAWRAASATRRSPLQVPTDSGDERENPALASVASEHFEPLEDCLDRERMAATVRRILAEETELARAVLLAEQKPADVAMSMGIPVGKVYQAVDRAMRALRAALCPEAT